MSFLLNQKTCFSFLLGFAVACCGVFAAQAQMPNMPPPQFQIPQKQTLSYSVDWRVFPAGTATFHLQAEGDRQHVTATAASIGAVYLLFPVADRYDAVFDRKTGCSYEYKKQIQEGHRRVTGQLNLDYGQHKQFLSEKNLVSGTSSQHTAPIPACVTDVLSGIFYLATQPLQVGHDVSFPLADAGRVVAVTAKVEAHEKVVTPAGTFATVRVQPTAAAGVVKNRGDIWIWYTDDARHLPVQVRAHLFWGTITMSLVSVKNQ
ncbi:MAG TPA: DUF3108 domain-containing protein [Acidobacteriaceae bacterium]|nr:DUF3108 domain-containing protein [Acidobacteriaceae bacterium]